jgi:hypothetical protein
VHLDHALIGGAGLLHALDIARASALVRQFWRAARAETRATRDHGAKKPLLLGQT